MKARKAQGSELQETRDHLRREVAVWLMAFRARFEELLNSVREVRDEARKPGSPLGAILVNNRLEQISSAMEDVDGHLPMMLVRPELPDLALAARRAEEKLS